ncbi:hypothetical protein [Oceanicoccus sp. KOV_DT_Chl]|uniref:hypothetical protein n=1 Tax=Oceanicoccus sp. KOV_DT_Chl TaxID=1904639 RepID=UPI000C7BCEED|nr:hypothetical protein [Oceanicoccus sp. KOV_DT_Chl]
MDFKERMVIPKDLALGNLWVLYFFVFAVILVIRGDAYLSDMMVMDDLGLFADSVLNPTDVSIHGFFYHLHNSFLKEISLVRLLYFMMLAGVGWVIISALNKISAAREVSSLAFFLTILFPLSSFLIVFVAGSYPILQLFFLSLTYLYICRVINSKRSATSIKKYVLLIFFLTFLQLAFAQSNMFLVLSVIFLPVWFEPSGLRLRSNFRQYWFATILVVVFLLILRYVEISWAHPYSKMSGRVSYNLISMLDQLLIFYTRLVASVDQKSLFFVYGSVAKLEMGWRAILMATASLVILFFSIVRWLLVRDYEKFKVSAFFVLCALLAVAPITVLNVHHPWYFFIPLLFSLCAVLYSSISIHSRAPIGVGILFFVLLVPSFWKVSEEINMSSRQQSLLIDAIRTESAEWRDKAQVFIKLPYVPKGMGTGPSLRYVRDTGFARAVTGRNDITLAQIGVKLDLELINLDAPVYFYTFNFDTQKLLMLKNVIQFSDQEMGYKYLSSQGEGVFTSSYWKDVSQFIFGIGRNDNNNLFLPSANIPQGIDISDDESIYKFLGETSLESFFNPGLDKFVVNFTFKGDNEYSGKAGFTETSPPMLTSSNVFSFYELSRNRLRVSLNLGSSKDSVDLNFTEGEWQKVSIAYTDSRVYVFQNGALRYSNLLQKAVRLTRIKVGLGYKSRYWVGQLTESTVDVVEENGKLIKRSLVNGECAQSC